jgi:phosphoheptose isomerase
VILISSSGQSENIVNGALRAKELKLRLITFSGFRPDNPLRKTGDINFWVDSREYNIVEMVHQVWLLAIVDKIIHDRSS